MKNAAWGLKNILGDSECSGRGSTCRQSRKAGFDDVHPSQSPKRQLTLLARDVA